MPHQAQTSHIRLLPLLQQRWSPRAFDSASVSEAQILAMIEAAGLAPSAYNSQPWRFLYSRRGDRYWTDFLAVLDDFNRSWAKRAGALIVLLSTPVDSDERKLPYHRFDCGAAWLQLALQASHMGLHSHAMAGLDRQQARCLLNIPEAWQVEIVIAVGRRGDARQLPESLRQREAPSPRLPLSTIAIAGALKSEAAL